MRRIKERDLVIYGSVVLETRARAEQTFAS